MNKKPKEIKKTRQFTMWVSEGELIRLRKLAQRKDMSMSEYIRQALFISFISDTNNIN
jgi:hypothetical protein